MKDYTDIFKQIVLIAAIPFVLFWLGVGLSYLFFPYNLDGASFTILTFAFAGCLIALFLTIHNIRFYGKKILKRIMNDSYLNS